MQKLVLILVLASVFHICVGQHRDEIDSLKARLKNVKEYTQSEINDMTGRLAWLFYIHSKYDSALSYYKRARVYLNHEPNRGWWGAINSGMGASYDRLNQFDSAELYYKKALTDFAAVADKENFSIVSTNLAILYRNEGVYEKALEHGLAAIKSLGNIPESHTLALGYNTVATIFIEIKNFPEAIKYYRRAITQFTRSDTIYLARSYNNIGELFILIEQYDSALVNLNRSLELKQKTKDTKGIARTINNLGKLSMFTNDIRRAERDLNQSFFLQQQIDDRIGMIEVLNNLGEFNLRIGNRQKSKTYLHDAEKLILRTGTPEYLRQNLELQVKLARDQKDFANGMMLMDKLLIIRDSLLNTEKSKSLQAMHIRYETEKKEQQIELLQQREETNLAKIRNSRVLIGALGIGLLLVAAIGSLIYINLRNARAAKIRIELLLAETRHRIKNNLQTLASIFHLQTRHYTDHAMVLEAQSSESRVHAMSMLHERFYNAEADHIINTRAYITDLVHKLVDVYGVRTTDFHLSLCVDDIELDIDKALALSLIIQELVCNAFKYAFDHKPDPQLSVSIRSRGDDVIATVEDNGKGLHDRSIGRSQGFSLVEALVVQLEGKMEYDNSDGTTFVIQFPNTQWKKRLFS
jgi:two-component sensor histidine kinase/Tfp pilus assembly protein PilF